VITYLNRNLTKTDYTPFPTHLLPNQNRLQVHSKFQQYAHHPENETFFVLKTRLNTTYTPTAQTADSETVNHRSCCKHMIVNGSLLFEIVQKKSTDGSTKQRTVQ
jgi:hypothetical protein